MRSMTGFGLGEATLRGGRLSSEVRSLNHRFLDLRVRLPHEISEQTFFVEQLCREQLGRGRFDVSIRVDGAALPPLSLDLERARATYRQLSALRDELAPGTDLPLSVLMSVPDLLAGGSHDDVAGLRAALTSSVSQALQRLDQMRAAEGAALGREITTRLGAARALLAQIARRAPDLGEAQRQRLLQRLERLTGGVEGLDSPRIATEVALLADRSDVREEVVRLESHFGQFDQLMGAPGPIGRKMDFLLQEMGRETNTIGAKCQDVDLSTVIVSLKAEIERLREQVQNVE